MLLLHPERSDHEKLIGRDHIVWESQYFFYEKVKACSQSLPHCTLLNRSDPSTYSGD